MDALFLFVFILTYLDVLGVETEKVKHFFLRLMGGMRALRGWGGGAHDASNFPLGYGDFESQMTAHKAFLDR